MSQASPVPTAPRRPSPFVVFDPEFEAVLGDAPRLAHVDGVNAHEGPVYAADEDALYFTTLPSDGVVDIKRLAGDVVSTVRPDAGLANGMALAPDGRLVVCEQRIGELTLVDRFTGSVEPLVTGFKSPNDVVVKSDGTVWFTDPSYGWLQGFRPEPSSPDAVYRYDPRTGELSAVADSLDKPNGLAFSPGETTLYVTDSGANQEPGSFYPERPHEIVAFDVIDGRSLGSPRRFAVVSPGFPDGIKVDSAGRVYSSSSSGVQVFAPEGRRLGEIAVPGAVNFCFGRDALLITADTAIYAAHIDAKGP